MKLKSKFASAALKARKEFGYTQSQVAEAISVSVRWYQKIESGSKMPSAVIALRIVAYLYLAVQEFRDVLGLVVPVSSARSKATIHQVVH